MAFSTAGGGPSATGPNMNVASLLDVLPVLIIVFMVVVIEQRPTGLQAEVPQSDALQFQSLVVEFLERVADNPPRTSVGNELP